MMRLPFTSNQPAAENRLVVYSAAFKEHCAALLDGFSQRHPNIEVDFRDGLSTALHKRYLAEIAADRPEADVFWSSAMDLQLGLVHDGHAQTYRSPEAAVLPQGAVYRDLAYATTVEPLVTLVNRDHFDLRLPAGSLGELAAVINGNSEFFHGRVACYDIEHSGLGFLALLHESRSSQDFGAFMQALTACRPRLFNSTPPLVEDINSSRAALGYHVLASFALRAVRCNPKLAIATTNAPQLAVSRVAFISKRAPHPHAAKLFIDYLLSTDGQRKLLDSGLFPIRNDNTSGATRLAPIWIDEGFSMLLDPQLRSRLLKQWKSAVATPATDSCP
jgi:iron(III) transport system substrate-binding protein